MLEYTTTISDDLETITIDFITEVDVNNIAVSKLPQEGDYSIVVTPVSSTQITFDITEDSEYLMDVYVTTVGEEHYEQTTLLISSRAVLCSNRKNRRDVTALLKVKKLDNTSRVTDCLNRVIVANHRLGKYTAADTILDLTNTNCGEDCQC